MTAEQIKKYNAEPVYNKAGIVVSYSFSPMSNGIKYFIDTYGADLVKAVKNSGVYFATAAAQKMVESGHGTSTFATKYNNFGGIKNFGKLKGASGTTSNGYAIFDSAYDCFVAYIDILKDTSKKYLSKGLLTAKSPEEQLMSIANGGYCANPKDPKVYAKPIIKHIDMILSMYPIGKIK